MTLKDPHTCTVELELAHGSTLHVKPNDVLQCLQQFDQSLSSCAWRITRLHLKNQQNSSLFDV